MDKPLLLQINEVSKTYDKTCVVNSFTLNQEASEIIALCGGNGAGKSTIIKMVTGIIQPTTGSIKVSGFEWQKKRIDYANQIGYMPDDFHFQQALSVGEFLHFYASLKKAEKNVLETLQLVGLSEHKNKLITKLSKGMRQRLLLAQALVAKPKLVVLDEPTNGLDPHWVQTFCEILLSIKQTNQGVLFSTHNLAVAEKVADKVLFLKNGKNKK